MPPIDYTIPGQFKGVQIESPINRMAAIEQLENARNQNALAQFQLGAAQRAETKETNRMRLLSEAGDDETAVANALLKSGDVAGYSAYVKSIADRKTQKLTQTKTTGDIVTTRLAQSQSFINNLNPDDPDAGPKFLAWHEANHNDEYLGPLLASRGVTAEQSRDKINAAIAKGPRAIADLINQSRLGIDKFRENENKRLEAAYDEYGLNETLAGRTPVSREEFYSRQREGQPAAAAPAQPPAPAPAPAAAPAPAPAAATEVASTAAPVAAPAPDAAAPIAEPAPGEDRMLPTDVTTGRRTGVEFLDPLAELLYALATRTKDKDRSAALRAMADKIQDGFKKQIENQQPVYSEINLQNKIAVVKRDPATGKTTVVDTFDMGISPADKERLKNESTRIKHETTKIGLDLRRVNLETKRVAIAEQNAARDADPAYQQRMAAARAMGEATAKDQVKAQAMLPGVIQRGEEGIRLIDELVGKAPVKDKNGKVIVEGTKPHPGFETAVGATWLPGARFIPGTDAANFQSRFDQIKGASFLEAFEILRGGGAITQVEGEKGTTAINRMALAQDEAEFIAAARDVQDIMNSGIKKARARVSGLSTSGTNAPKSGVRAKANEIIGIP
jgi:hypothetical protein